jgi:uncharacterized protein (DUF362 family)
MKPLQGAKVIIRSVREYDAERIRTVVREGLNELGLEPRGRTLVKPNLVVAGDMFRHAHTRPEFGEGVLLALKDCDRGRMTELGVGERCGITIPSRYVFKESGFDQVIERVGATRYLFDEVQQVRVPLTHEKRLRDYIYVPEPIARTDFFVNCPKFKSHPWTTVTFCLKNYIGIQDDRHRLIDHDHALNRKVADLQHVIQPEFVAIDCITAGESRMLTPIPRDLGLVIMSNNQVAADAICCRLIAVDPYQVEHIRLAHEDGFGPLSAAEIELSGDVSLDEARARAAGFRVGLVRVEKYFEGSRISAYAGPPPGADRNGYCWGGCPGAFEEAIEVLRLYDQRTDEKLPRLHFVFGDYKGELDVAYGEKVVFVGDCCTFEGHVGQELVQIRNVYQDRSTLRPEDAKHDDIYAKMVDVLQRIRAAKHLPFLRLEGCPVSVAELILVLAELGNTKNPYLDPREILRFNAAYLGWRAKRAANWLEGIPYLRAKEVPRGGAAPVLEPTNTND